MDALTIEKIKKEAHPLLVNELLKIYEEANNKLGKCRLRFSYILRTFEEQALLYAQGRTKAGKKVTDAAAGQSYHNYGFAVDIVLLIDKDGNGTYEAASWDTIADWDKDGIADWLEVVQVFNKYGWQWGFIKNGKRWDLPHFQKTFGKNWKQLKALHDAKKVDKRGFVII